MFKVNNKQMYYYILYNAQLGRKKNINILHSPFPSHLCAALIDR